MRRWVSVALVGLVLATMARPRPADALALKAGEIVAGVAFEKTVQHLERCRALPAASKGALSQGLNVMRRTPNGWAKALIGAGALYYAWQQAKQGYIDEQAAKPMPMPPLGGAVEKVGDSWNVAMPAHPEQTHLVRVYDRDGNDTGAVYWLYPGHYTYDIPASSGHTLVRFGGDPWGELSRYGPMPDVFRPGDQIEDNDRRLDNMTKDPNWRNRFKSDLELLLEEETAVTPNVDNPYAPFIWQKPGTTGTQPDDWVISEPQTEGEYPSPEAGGDTGIGTSPDFDPNPQPTAGPSTAPSAEPSTGPSIPPSTDPTATPSPEPTEPDQPTHPNWWAHLYTTLQTKFPFDIIGDLASMPSYADSDLSVKTFGTTWDLNFIKPIYRALHVVATLSLLIWALLVL